VAGPRFIIGVDLGTTNTAVAYVDTHKARQKVQTFEIPQLVAPGSVDPRGQLPSFVYLAGEHDLGPAETELPWDPRAESRGGRVVVGELARSAGARQPSRLIASAKSWLCHAGVDRRAPILPWGQSEGPRLSPVEASARILGHVRAAWDHLFAAEPDARFAAQDIILTVPASFDEAARELTLEAAAQAGLAQVVLLEEPQAAFYAWMNSHLVKRRLSPGERVLVFDVGGGTTDFTVVALGEDGRFDRTAVGDHLLLGGDNVDLTLAKRLEGRLLAGGRDGQPEARKLDARKLDAVAWQGLVHACRLAKEAMLCDRAVKALPVTVSGRGSRLIGGTLKTELSRQELEEVLFDGFFPQAERHERPRRSRGGLHEFGLPYAADPAITRHLGAFFTRHGIERVDAVLFNGGAMAPAALRRRVLEQIAHWQAGAAPRELSSKTPALAVAQGAAHYGLVRRGLGVRIGGGTPRAFYVGVGRSAAGERSVCLAQKGLVEGQTVSLARDFSLLTNRPVSFKLFSSTTRDDSPGTLLTLVSAPGAEADGAAEGATATVSGPGSADDAVDLVELPPIVTALRAPGRNAVTVRLEVRMTELGALEIWCRETPPAESGEGTWRLSFDMRAGGAADAQAEGESDGGGNGEGRVTESAAPDPRLAPAREVIRRAFEGAPENLAGLMRELERTLEAPRDAWTLATSRALFDAGLEVEELRKKSPQHESRWLHLVGFCLRPGTGAPLDDWRAKQMWRIFNDDLLHPRAESCRLAWWIVWRRVAGGLGKGHQHQIYLRLAQLFLPGAKGRKKWDELKPSAEEASEMLRCLANLERISAEAKIPLGDEIVRRLDSRKAREDPLHPWALGRLGGRLPLYGPLNCVVPAGTAARWLQAVLAYEWPDPQKLAFSVAQLARRTGDRSRDLDESSRQRAAAWLTRAGATRAALLVEQVVDLEAKEQHIALGDSLPPGLRLLGEGA